MRKRTATPRARDRSNERFAARQGSQRALLWGVSMTCGLVALVVCLPERWVVAGDSSDARSQAHAVARRGTAALSRAEVNQRSSGQSRAIAVDLDDSANQGAASNGDFDAAQPARLASAGVEPARLDSDENARSRSALGGNTFGFDAFAHVGPSTPSRPADGPFVDHYPDGGVAVEGRYEQGEREGDWDSYYPDGSLRLEGQYSAGKKVGRWKAYHPSGQLLGEGEYSGGLREGNWVLYYSNGLVKEQGVFEHDLRHGPWQYYDAFGQLEARSGFYRYGRML